ncbi:hypothetical protein CKM354_000355100 [Cercospora kikuchii]|uniref:Uncharacterized protein n=1 Tax=Cercospora kikuchii TaxID=84275 RepID=A0A9P3FEW7_9PEZI|nr:uncharacterized protein CKM354_000355100 [Cercospora kikuchii]GIZ40199.1 hypothetical protein CKM354_000355100 [Cercospora kikuchii]
MELRWIGREPIVAVLRPTAFIRPSRPVVQSSSVTAPTARRPLSHRSSPPTPRARSQHARIQHIRQLATASTPQPPKPYTAPDLSKIHRRVQELSSSVLQPGPGTLPAEERVLYTLEQLEYLAKVVLEERGADSNPRAQAKEQKETATSALLGSVNARSYPAVISKASILNVISESAEQIARDPNVFVTPAILKAYVQLQSLLHQPSSFPDVFHLYSNKPIPSLKGSQVVYSSASPDQIKSAIPSDVAKEALGAAIEAHQLPLAIDIISTSYCTPSFKKAKTFKQAAIPMAGLGIAPIAAYTLSTQFSNLQQTMDTGTATGIAFAGIMTYVGAVAMTGYVAVTTSNDQMDRVTWASGVPLWERWVREEERAAIDRLAGAWGFKDMDKRGEEEGEEWEALRDWVGTRGMVLDRVSLMPGME